MCKVVLNNNLNGVELYFEGKPEKTTLTNLKSSGFRWNGKKLCWYAKQNDETLKAANELSEGKTIEPVVAVAEKKNIIDLFEIINGDIPEKKEFETYDYKGIAKEVRISVKKLFPFVKFSIRSSHSEVSCNIISSPFLKDSDILNSIKEYCVKIANQYKYTHDFYGGYFQIDCDYKQIEAAEEIKEMEKLFNIKMQEQKELKRIQEQKEFEEFCRQEEIRKETAAQEKINRFFKMNTSKLSIEGSEAELKNIKIVINENIDNEELRQKLRDVENNIKYNYSSRLEAIEDGTIEITIDGEGLIDWGIVSTFSVEEATKELNKRIKYVYSDCGGYLKTWVRLRGKDFDITQRYDLDDTLNTIENLFLFMAEEKQDELIYMEKHINSMNWIKDKEQEIQVKKNLIELFENLYNDSNIKVEEKHTEREEVIEKIEDKQLYKINRLSNEFIIRESRIVKNDYANAISVAYGKDIKDMLQEGIKLHIKDIEAYDTNIEYFIDGLYKVATGKCISLFPTAEEKKMQLYNMYDRFMKNKNRVVGE